MTLKDIVPWRWGGLRHWSEEDRPYESFLREMGNLHQEMDRLPWNRLQRVAQAAIPDK